MAQALNSQGKYLDSIMVGFQCVHAEVLGQAFSSLCSDNEARWTGIGFSNHI